MVENRLKLRRSLFLGTDGRLFVLRGRIVRVQHFTGDSISIRQTAMHSALFFFDSVQSLPVYFG